MALSCLSGPEKVSAVIAPPIQSVEAAAYVMDHLRFNLQEAAEQMGRNEDEAQILLHCVIQSLTKRTNVQGDMQSKGGRRKWESQLAEIVKPEINELAANVSRVETVVREDQSATENALFEVLKAKDPLTPNNMFENAAMWKPRVYVNLDNITAKIGKDRLKAECPNFHRLLTDQSSLCVVESLAHIVQLQSAIVEKFGGRIEIELLGNLTVGEFVSSKEWKIEGNIEDYVNIFLGAFNTVRNHLDRGAREFCKVNYTFTCSADVQYCTYVQSHNCPFS